MMKARYFDNPPRFELWGDTKEDLISVACYMTDPTHPERFSQRVFKGGSYSACYALGGPPPEST
jgi:hypothetical protein